MYRKIFKAMVLIIGMLTANLVTIWLDEFMLAYKWQYPPYIFTWIGMGIVVLIYYPLFTRIDKWATKIGDKFMRAGKKFVGREIGSFLAFLVALLILFFLYGLEWFDTNVYESFFRSL
jgi:uncharacterized protein YacL